jgi:uncharacterized protein
VRWDAVHIYRLAGGMIVEEWAADDATAILYQVGAYTPPWLRLQGQPTRREPGDQDRGSRPGQSQRRSRCNRRGTDQHRRPRLQECSGGSRRGIVTPPIANPADFAALDLFFRIIEQGLDGLAGPSHFWDLLAEDLAVHHDATKGVVVLEYASEGHVVGTGRRYANRYISVLTLREGEVAHWRDYLDPVAVFDPLG